MSSLEFTPTRQRAGCTFKLAHSFYVRKRGSRQREMCRQNPDVAEKAHISQPSAHIITQRDALECLVHIPLGQHGNVSIDCKRQLGR